MNANQSQQTQRIRQTEPECALSSSSYEAVPPGGIPSPGNSNFESLISAGETAEWVLFGQTTQPNDVLSSESLADSLAEVAEYRAFQELREQRQNANQRIDEWQAQSLGPIQGRLIEDWGLATQQGREIRVCSHIDEFYGDCVLRGRSAQELKVIRRVLRGLSRGLTRDHGSLAVVPQYADRTQFMSNRCLEKYIPLFLRRLMVESIGVAEGANFWEGSSGSETCIISN